MVEETHNSLESWSTIWRLSVNPLNVQRIHSSTTPGSSGSFLGDTKKKKLKVFHRAACRIITGCLAFIPSSPVFLDVLFSRSKSHLRNNHSPSSNESSASRLMSSPYTSWPRTHTTKIEENNFLEICLLKPEDTSQPQRLVIPLCSVPYSPIKFHGFYFH